MPQSVTVVGSMHAPLLLLAIELLWLLLLLLLLLLLDDAGFAPPPPPLPKFRGVGEQAAPSTRSSDEKTPAASANRGEVRIVMDASMPWRLRVGGESSTLAAMATRADTEVSNLMDLAAEVVARARRAGADVAEAIARSGSELSTKVRLGEPELVEEAAYRSLGMRVIKQKRVALTSTSDLTPRGIDRFVKDAMELADISQEDPFSGPAAPELIAKGP